MYFYIHFKNNMKRNLRIAAMILAILVAMFLGTSNVYASTGKVINDSTRLRKKASTTSEVVETITKNETVEVISEEGEWYKVKYKTSEGMVEGYIRNDLLDVEKTETTTEEKKEDEKKEETTEKTNSDANSNSNQEISEEEIKENSKIELKNDTNIQLLPLIFSSKVGKIPAKTEVTITEVIGLWCHVETEDQDGWIMKSKLETAQAVEAKKEETKKEETKQAETKKEDKATEQKKEETTSTKISAGTKLYITTTTLNLREKAESGSRILEQLDYGTELTVVETVDNTWTKVKYNSYTGYVASQYLSKNKPKDVTNRGMQETRQTTETNTTNTTNATKTETNKTENKTTNTETKKTENKTTNITANTTKKTETKKTETKKSNTTSTKTESTKKTTSTTSSSSKKKTSSSKATGSDIVAYAKKFLGYRYVYGTAGPDTFDCSGFTSYVYKHFGYTLNRTSGGQRSNGKGVSKDELQPGDILCFSGHVGIYIGGNQFIHAANSKRGVIITSLSSSYYVKHYITARRIIY